jgi:hypothetical protein
MAALYHRIPCLFYYYNFFSLLFIVILLGLWASFIADYFVFPYNLPCFYMDNGTFLSTMDVYTGILINNKEGLVSLLCSDSSLVFGTLFFCFS